MCLGSVLYRYIFTHTYLIYTSIYFTARKSHQTFSGKQTHTKRLKMAHQGGVGSVPHADIISGHATSNSMGRDAEALGGLDR